MQSSNAVNQSQTTGYEGQIQLEQWCRSTNARRLLQPGWEKAPANFLGHRLAKLYIEKAREIYSQKRGCAGKFGVVMQLIETDDQLVQVGLEALLYTLANVHRDRPYNELCGSIGKRAEYVLWLMHPKWQRSWHLHGLRLASHNDLGMRQIIDGFKSKGFRLGADYKPLAAVEKVALGAFFIEIMVLSTGMIEVYIDKESKRATRKVRYTQMYWDFAKRWRDNIVMFRPLYMPMIIPPKPYTKHDDGGYMSIATGCCTVDWTRFNQTISQAGPSVMRALNRLQEEEFCLDWSQIRLLRDCYEKNHEIGDLPNAIQMPHPGEAVGEKRTREEWKDIWAWKADQRKNATRAKFVHALVATERLRQNDKLWFVWQMDHRGRLYPRGSQLTFSASDPFRTMLQFHRVSPVKGHEKELSWHLGSALGLPPSHSIRWDWLTENSGLVERIGTYPMENLAHWAKAKEPWRFIQIARDWAQYVSDPGYQTGTVYRLDQTTSGYGHVACLLRDARLAGFTNIVGDRPVDLYTGVSRLVHQRVEQLIRDEEDERRRTFLEWWLKRWPDRSMWKVMVMPLVYGRTYRTLHDQINNYLRDELENFLTEEGYRIYELAAVFASVVHEYCKELFPGLNGLVKWLSDIAAAQMDCDMRPCWVTPNGFLVESYRTFGRDADVETKLSGQKFKVHIKDHEGGELDRRKSRRQLGADFVHSMDAAFLQTFVCHWGDALRKPIVTIHDCFGTTLENAATLRAELNDQWCRFYSVDHLMNHWRWSEQMTGRALKLPPCIGTLDTKRIGENPFLFS